MKKLATVLCVAVSIAVIGILSPIRSMLPYQDRLDAAPGRERTDHVRKAQKGPTWQRVVMASNNPEEICRAVSEQLAYVDVTEEEGRKRDSRRVWRRKSGDCEDFAAVIRDMCRERGFKADVYVFASLEARRGHAIVVGNWRGQMWMSSNGSYDPIASMADAKRRVKRELDWHSAAVVYWKSS